MLKVRSFLRLANSVGISPDRSLSAKPKNTRLTSLPNDAGIGPVSLFSVNPSDSSLVSSPISGGMLPSSWLQPIKRCCKLEVCARCRRVYGW